MISVEIRPGFSDYLFSIASLSVSFIAIWIAICTAQKQNKIALLDKRQKVIDDFQKYIDEVENDWHSSDPDELFSRYTDTYLKILFDIKMVEFSEYLQKQALVISELRGDLKHAESHILCHGKDQLEISGDIDKKIDDIREKFSVLSEHILPKFFKL